MTSRAAKPTVLWCLARGAQATRARQRGCPVGVGLPPARRWLAPSSVGTQPKLAERGARNPHKEQMVLSYHIPPGLNALSRHSRLGRLVGGLADRQHSLQLGCSTRAKTGVTRHVLSPPTVWQRSTAPTSLASLGRGGGSGGCRARQDGIYAIAALGSIGALSDRPHAQACQGQPQAICRKHGKRFVGTARPTSESMQNECTCSARSPRGRASHVPGSNAASRHGPSLC